ncbi:hypothetical protein MKW94_017665 [Papaver nudicaule]|uniref:Uncharacterized protein n=1 Tax=Papaver nudicaule TaxID=74823 RepID=A0AA41VJV9_PAPNU|nr:hypothetical protein [Papaver nudicaule]
MMHYSSRVPLYSLRHVLNTKCVALLYMYNSLVWFFSREKLGILGSSFVMDKTEQNNFLEGILGASTIWLSFCCGGACFFIQALSIVGSHDPLVQHSLVVLYWVFGASFIINTLCVSITIALRLKFGDDILSNLKFSHIISIGLSFLLMVLGYGLLIAFNIQGCWAFQR